MPLSVSTASEVTAALQDWARVFATGEPVRLTALYLPDAVLWGTLSTELIQGHEGIRQYFERAFASGVPPQVVLGEPLTRVYEETAVSSGQYTFTLHLQGQVRTMPARFSFALRKVDGRWRIADHHSSLMPAAL